MYNTTKTDKTWIDNIFTHQFIMPHAQRRTSQRVGKNEKKYKCENEKIGIQNF